MIDAEHIIQRLGLVPLEDEGGFYRETYRSSVNVAVPSGGGSAFSSRSASTAIYYLLIEGNFSAMHRLRTDEVYHYYCGGPVEMLCLHPTGVCETVLLGRELDNGHRMQVVIPAMTWQGASVVKGGKWCLLGCTVAPGFDVRDRDMATRSTLQVQFPSHAARISELTRG